MTGEVFLPTGRGIGEILVPGLWGRSGDGFLGIPLSDPSCMGELTSVGGGPVASVRIQDILCADDGYSGVTGRGVQGGGGGVN